MSRLDTPRAARIIVAEGNVRGISALRKLTGLALAVALTAATTPAARAAEGSATLWGVVPDTLRSSTTEVVTERVGGARVSSLPAPTDGRFTFGNLAAGDYVVRLMDSTGFAVAQSQVARVQPAESVEAIFEERTPSPAVVFGGGGPSKALLIAGGAAVAGVVTVIALTAGDEPQPASPSR